MIKRKYQILMLEDDPDDRYITETYFEELGRKDVAVEFVDRPMKFISHLKSISSLGRFPDLIVIDSRIPSIAIEVLQSIKSDQEFRKIPTVIISGVSSKAVINLAYEEGANSFIMKPSTNEGTRETIGSFLEYWFQTAELPS